MLRVNQLASNLALSKEKHALLLSRLKDHKLLAPEVLVGQAFTRQQEFMDLFSKTENDELFYCNDIKALFFAMDIEYIHTEWRMFIDSSKDSLKVALINRGKQLPTIPIAYSNKLKENKESMELLLRKIKYEQYEWEICGDFKIISILTGVQDGYTKHMCYMCEWNSREKHLHYTDHVWPLRCNRTAGEKNIQYESLVPISKILMPPVHIKLGLIKNFVVAVIKSGNEAALNYLKGLFPRISNEKIKAGIFIGPDIRKMMKDINFDATLNEVQLNAWKHIKNVIHQFLGNKKHENYRQIVSDMITAISNANVLMSLKIHMLKDHIDICMVFPDNLGEVSDEHGEKFHQELKMMETNYKGKSRINMLSDYCWSVKEKCDESEYSRQPKKARH